jgi:hypothetical protein
MTLLQIDNLIAVLKQHKAYNPNMSLEDALATRAAIRDELASRSK